MRYVAIDFTGADRTGVACAGCGAPTAMICDECLQASARHWWGAVQRTPEPASVSGGWCRLCHVGGATWCAICWPGAVVALRDDLGHPRASRPCMACCGEGLLPALHARKRLCRDCSGTGRVPA